MTKTLVVLVVKVVVVLLIGIKVVQTLDMLMVKDIVYQYGVKDQGPFISMVRVELVLLLVMLGR